VKDADRTPQVVLREITPVMAILATRGLYEEQPELWQMGERGRERTVEDFGHHFEALGSLNQDIFMAHVEYCETMFQRRGFPGKWLDDAWRWMAIVIERELPDSIAVPAIDALAAATRGQRLSKP